MLNIVYHDHPSLVIENIVSGRKEVFLTIDWISAKRNMVLHFLFLVDTLICTDAIDQARYNDKNIKFAFELKPMAAWSSMLHKEYGNLSHQSANKVSINLIQQYKYLSNCRQLTGLYRLDSLTVFYKLVN